MSRNALDVALEAFRLWREVHGDESLLGQCVRFDNYYWTWAYQGHEDGIVSYDPALAAANASKMFTTDVNDPSIRPGNLVFWESGSDGHIGTVVGRDAAGRVLVTHTGARGQDVVLNIGQSVVVSHADSINRTVIGVARACGKNVERTGLTAWSPDAAIAGFERAPGGEPGAPMWPVGPQMERLQRALAGRTAFGEESRYEGRCDGQGGPLTAKGIQLTLNISEKNGVTPYVVTPVDGKLGINNAWGVQHYGLAYGDYPGKMDGDPLTLSWEAFIVALERP